jgi:hypothetical protein
VSTLSASAADADAAPTNVATVPNWEVEFGRIVVTASAINPPPPIEFEQNQESA